MEKCVPIEGENILGNTFSEDKSIALWLKKACGSTVTVKNYVHEAQGFFDHAGVKPDELLGEWKRVKYDFRLREQFVDEWTEKIEGYVYSKDMAHYAPLTRMQSLTAIVSDHVSIIAENKTLTLDAVGDLMTSHAEIKEGSKMLVSLEAKEKAKAVYSLSYLSEILGATASIADLVTIAFSQDMPVKVDLQLPFPDGKLTYYLAPRIEVE